MTMVCSRTLKRCATNALSFLELRNTLPLFIFLVSTMSFSVCLWHVFVKARHHIGPVLQDTWTPVVGLTDTYVFNAYFTGRDNLVRIVGIGPTDSKARVQCMFYPRNGEEDYDDSEVPKNHVLGTLVQMLDSHKLM